METIDEWKWFTTHKTPEKPFQAKFIDVVNISNKWVCNVIEIPSKEKLEEIISINPFYKGFFVAWDNWFIKINSIEQIRKNYPWVDDKILTTTFKWSLLDLYKSLYGIKKFKTKEYTKNVDINFWDDLEIQIDWLYKNNIKIYTFYIELEWKWHLKVLKKL